MGSRLPNSQKEHHSSFELPGDFGQMPESPESGAVDSHANGMDINLHISRAYGPMVGQKPATLELFSTIAGLGPAPNPGTMLESPGTMLEGPCDPPPYPMFNYLFNDKAGPWNSVHPRSNDLRGRDASFEISFATGGLMTAMPGYRNPVPSECDTIGPGLLHSDSGYGGSNAKQSVGIPSQYGDPMDRSAETQSIARALSDVHLQPGLADAAWPHYITPQAEATGIICPFCDENLKTKAELHKHENRHTKPHKCDVPGCLREEGFSTKNDLTRHKGTVHGMGASKYRCSHGTCAEKTKVWSRPDNFRQHLKRVHKIEIGSDQAHNYRFDDEERGPADLGSEPPAADDVVENMMTPNWAGMQDQADDCDSLDGNSYPAHLDDSPGHGFSLADGDLTDGNLTSLSLDGNEDGMDEREKSLGTAEEQSSRSTDILTTHENAPQSRNSGISGGIPDPSMSCIRPEELRHTPLSEERRESVDRRPGPLEVTPDGVDGSEVDDPMEVPEKSLKPPHQPAERASSTSSGRDPAVGIDAGSLESGTELDEGLDRATQLDSCTASTSSRPAVLASAIASPAASTPTVEDTPASKLEATIPETNGEDSDEGKTSSILEALKAQGKLDKYLHQLGYRRLKELDVKTKKVPTMPQTENKSKCDLCNKQFGRRCELRKHMKRHEKPYGCTFSGCSKSFGSKNDWKRHENGQHSQVEVWKCNLTMKDAPEIACRKSCSRRESFKLHLQKDHGMDDIKAIEDRQDRCRLGRNCDTQFWCGFCEKVIATPRKEGPAGAERFDHIDDHFFGRRSLPRKSISQWKAVDSDSCQKDAQRGFPEDLGLCVSRESTLPDSMAQARASPLKPSRKRHLDATDRLDAEPKRQKTLLTLWFCCQCSAPPSTIINFACTESNCGHRRCGGCRTERHSVPLHEEETET